MNISKNVVIAVVGRQINANMQAHMRGINSDKEAIDEEINQEELRRNELEKEFKKFITSVHRFLYRAIGVASTDNDFEEWLNRIEHNNQNDVAEYLEMINDEFLDSPSFSNAIINKSTAPIKHLGESTSIVKSDKTHDRRTATTSISYIPGITNDEPNIIRIGITEEIGHGMEFLNGNIDICSNGEIFFNDFEKIIYTVKEEPNNDFGWAIDEKGNIIYTHEETLSDIKESFVAPESLDSIKEYIMKIFELSNLKTKSSNNIHR